MPRLQVTINNIRHLVGCVSGDMMSVWTFVPGGMKCHMYMYIRVQMINDDMLKLSQFSNLRLTPNVVASLPHC